MTQTWFATLALLSWPALALWLYRTQRASIATLWTILGAQLWLPVGAVVKIGPMIPALDKTSIPNLSALVGCALVGRQARFLSARFGLAEILLLMSAIGPFITSELNGDDIIVGHTFLPSVGHYEALSAAVNQLLFLLPFLLGRQILRTETENADILRVLVIAGLIYSLPILFEIRMSPQLHLWLYGYLTAFATEIRDNGFRPVVFMGNGLLVAFFMMTTAVAAGALWRARIHVQRLPSGGVTAYLSVILFFCKSLGAISYGAALVPLVRLAKPQLQIRVALALASIALLYPVLRAADLVPTGPMVEFATSADADRAKSLQFRFDQEQQLLNHASERFLFGWGRFGRNRV
jgi:hypothetical protein